MRCKVRGEQVQAEGSAEAALVEACITDLLIHPNTVITHNTINRTTMMRQHKKMFRNHSCTWTTIAYPPFKKPFSTAAQKQNSNQGDMP